MSPTGLQIAAACQEMIRYCLRHLPRGRSRADPREVALLVASIFKVIKGISPEPLVDTLVPGFDWPTIRQECRIRRGNPMRCKFVDRAIMETALATIQHDLVEKLREIPELAVVVIDHDVTEVLSLSSLPFLTATTHAV